MKLRIYPWTAAAVKINVQLKTQSWIKLKTQSWIKSDRPHGRYKELSSGIMHWHDLYMIPEEM